MPKVEFVPSGKIREIKSGGTILAAANQVKLPIGQSCDGDGVCGWCRVTIIHGLEQIAPPTDLEKKLMTACSFGANERAACLAKVRGDITVTTSYW